MSTIITGVPTNNTTGLTATVSGATNASPIVITTSANHLYATGDRVTVNGVLGNTAANGTWSIIVLSSTTFSLTGSTGNGAYTSGGTCLDNSFTPQFTIPSDGDARNAASVNVAFQTLADRTQSLIQALTLRGQTFNSSGTWTAPAGCTRVLVIGWGGGGSGGNGVSGGTVANITGMGGSAGGGAPRVLHSAAVTPGVAYTVTVDPGASAPAATTGAAGIDGGASVFSGPSLTLTFPGGGGGAGGSAQSGNTPTALEQGGLSPAAGKVPATLGGMSLLTGGDSNLIAVAPGQGGNVYAGSATVGTGGAQSGFAGGAGGASGTLSGTFYGGRGGSGGGAGGGGAGGAGGAGGNGASAGTGTAGSAGTAGAANTGAGGGGGGAGGAGSTAGGTFGTGAAGGSGQITVIWESPI